MTTFGWKEWLGSASDWLGTSVATTTAANDAIAYYGVNDNWVIVPDSCSHNKRSKSYAYATCNTPSTITYPTVQYQLPDLYNTLLTGDLTQLGAAAQGLGGMQQQVAYQQGAIYQQMAMANINANYWHVITGVLGEPPETAEEKTARVKRELEREAKRKAASLRAESLLFTILTPSQVKQYTDDACFDVEVNGRVYRLACNSRSGNVVLLENGKAKFSYCAHPHDAHEVPIPDVLLSQLLMLRSDEAQFLRIANRTVLQ